MALSICMDLGRKRSASPTGAGLTRDASGRKIDLAVIHCDIRMVGERTGDNRSVDLPVTVDSTTCNRQLQGGHLQVLGRDEHHAGLPTEALP